MKLYDAIIIGAGPSGSYVAQRLAASGHKVVVFEQHERIGQGVCCTGIIGKECIDTFSIDKSVILREAKSAKLFAPSGKFFRLEKGTAQAYVVDRTAFDVALAKRAQEEGAEYLLGYRVKDITFGDDSLQVEAVSTRRGVSISAKTVAIASGFGSNLQQELELGRIDDFVTGAQAEVDVNGIGEVEVYLSHRFAPGFFAWLVPTSGGRGLVGLLSRHSPGQNLRDFLSYLEACGKIALSETKISYGTIPLRPLPKTYRERVIVVGDAAGQTKPTTGGGIYYGLLCGQVAADVLCQALPTNNFSTQMFARYEEEWRKKLSTELRIGYRARRFFEQLSDRQIEKMFHIIQSNNIHQRLLDSADFSFDWHSDLILRGLKYFVLQGAAHTIQAPWRRLKLYNE
jgi:geranylgeranyl reductase family protein